MLSKWLAFNSWRIQSLSLVLHDTVEGDFCGSCSVFSKSVHGMAIRILILRGNHALWRTAEAEQRPDDPD